jgi:hypothetical protein
MGGIAAVRRWPRPIAWPSRPALIVFVVSLGPAAIQLHHWGWFLHLPAYLDFGNYYLYARMGMHDGWNTLYDLTVEYREWLSLGGIHVLPMFPMIYPPPLAWLVAPFTFLPLLVAFTIWATMILGLFLWMWTVTAPGTRFQRWTLLSLAIGASPVALGLILAQALVVVLAAVVGAWYLLRRQHQVAAGLLLLLMAIKPQLAFFVPFTLLAAGYRRTFAVWAVGMALIVLLAIVSLGPDGVHAYQERLHAASNGAAEYVIDTSMSIPGLLGRGWLSLAGQATAAALALWAAYRRRRDGLEFAIIAGLIGSLLITPYVHRQDLTALIVAGWLYLRTAPPRIAKPFLIVGYLLVAGYFQLVIAVLTGGPGTDPVIVAFEILWLLLIAYPIDLPVWRRQPQPLESAA